MSFYEDIAQGLDLEGVESRITQDGLYVPIAPDLEIMFVEIEAAIPAAQIFVSTPEDVKSDVLISVAGSDVDPAEDADSEEEPEDPVEGAPALVGVAFDVDSAVNSVQKYIATDQVITILEDLLDGADDRLHGIEFRQDLIDPLTVRADVADNSEIVVTLNDFDGATPEEPSAQVSFISFTDDPEEILEGALAEFWEQEHGEDELHDSDYERQRIYQKLIDDVVELTQEVLELGTFSDFNQLFDVLEVARNNARQWESMLVPLDEQWSE